MASALELMGQGVMYRSTHSRAGVAGMYLADTVVGAGASYGLAQLYGRFPDKVYGKHAFDIAGGVGKLLEGVLAIGFGPGWASGLAGAVGQAGLNGRAMEMAFSQLRKEKGIVLAKVPAGTDLNALKIDAELPAHSTRIGALPQAVSGRGLAWDHVGDLASMH